MGGADRRVGQGEPSRSQDAHREQWGGGGGTLGGLGGPARKTRKRSIPKPGSSPNIRNITSHDLADTARLITLHAQAVKIGLASPTESGRLDFLALAQRARMHGKRGGALFFYLLRENKTGFITLGAEDEASRLLKAHLYGVQKRVKDQATHQEQWGGVVGVGNPKSGQWEKKNGQSKPEVNALGGLGGRPEYSKDEQFVIACMRVAMKHRIGDAFRIAHAEGWTRDRWDTTVELYETTKFAIRQSELMKEVGD